MISRVARVACVMMALGATANAHGVLTLVKGANGVTSSGFGVLASTPRDGTRANPFQQDSSIIRDNEIASGTADFCGRTRAGGNNDVATQLDAASSAGLPSAAADGSVTMTLHQVNGDGAGPYTCDVSADATGQNFVAMTVTTNVPGRNSRSNARAQDFALVAQMPAGTSCTGGPNGDACIVRCRNAARAGPFGGCVAVTNGDTAAAKSAGAGAATAAGAAQGASAGTSAGTATGATTGSAAGAAKGASAGTTAGTTTGTTAGTAAGAAQGESAGTTAGTATGATTGSAAGAAKSASAGTTAGTASGATTGSAAGAAQDASAGTTTGTTGTTTGSAAAVAKRASAGSAADAVPSGIAVIGGIKVEAREVSPSALAMARKFVRAARLARSTEEDQVKAVAAALEEQWQEESALSTRAITDDQRIAEAEEAEADEDEEEEVAVAKRVVVPQEKKRWIKSRVVGRSRAYKWL